MAHVRNSNKDNLTSVVKSKQLLRAQPGGHRPCRYRLNIMTIRTNQKSPESHQEDVLPDNAQAEEETEPHAPVTQLS